MVTITDRMGRMQDDHPGTALAALVRELDAFEDDEHSEVAVSDGSGWSLTARTDGRLVWENVEDLDIPPRHMYDVSREDVLRLFRVLAEGGVALIDREPWHNSG